MDPFLTCKEMLDFLGEYYEDGLPEAQRREFDRHLAICPSCVNYVETYKSTILLSRDALCGPDDKLPDDVPEPLIAAILAARKKDAQ